MSDITATSGISKAAAAMKTLLAASSAFQTAVGAADAAAAAAIIHLGSYTPEEDAALAVPFALISDVSLGKSRAIGTAAWLESGTFKIQIERAIPTLYRSAAGQTNAELEFKNTLGAILAEVRDKSTQAGYLMLRTLDITDGPYRYEPQSGLGSVMGCWLTAEWGME
jgi:hypothetical protein